MDFLLIILAMMLVAGISLIGIVVMDAMYEHKKSKASKKAKIKRCVLFDPFCTIVIFVMMLDISVSLLWFIM